MDRRLRRGKHMPPPPPPRDDDSDDSDASSEEAEGNLSNESTKVRHEIGNDEDDLEDLEEEEEDTRVQTQAAEETMEVSDEEFHPPPTPNVQTLDEILEGNCTPLQLTDTSNLGDMFEELIQKCDKLDKGEQYDENFLREMCKNINRGQELFEYIKKGTSEQTPDASGNKRFAGPGGMYLAYLHTKITSNMIRNRAEHIGSGNTIFTVEKYLASLQNYYLDENGCYCDKVASGCIAAESSHQSLTLNPLVAVVGAFDGELAPVQKVRKPRVQRKQNEDEQQEMSVDDGIDPNTTQNLHSNPVAENIAKDMNKVLKQVYRQQNRPLNLFEFTMDRTSFPKTVENIFYLSFLVKDGYVSLAKDENERLKDYSLNIKPEKAQNLKTATPEDDDDTRNQIHRQKYILSFSPTQWKQFCAMSTGECTMAHFQEWLETQQGLPMV